MDEKGNYILDENDVVNKKWRNYEYWEKYTDKQLESLKYLTNLLCEEFNINNDCIINK